MINPTKRFDPLSPPPYHDLAAFSPAGTVIVRCGMTEAPNPGMMPRISW
jgi:hypothetical protein